jgi:hypothetical protein
MTDPTQAPPAMPAGHPANIGKVRSTGTCVLLMIVTLGIYGLFWWFMTHDEMKKHSGTGLGGPLALVIAFFFGIVMPFITSNEVAGLYSRAGRPEPVTAMTGLWYFPGAIIIVGPIIWFVKTNGALNEYWKSLGAAA